MIVLNYIFSPGPSGVGSITFTDYASIRLEDIQLITNVDNHNIRIFQFNTDGKGGDVVDGTNVLLLDFDTSSMSSADRLQIIIDPDDRDIFGRQNTNPSCLSAAYDSVEVVPNAFFDGKIPESGMMIALASKEVDAVPKPAAAVGVLGDNGSGSGVLGVGSLLYKGPGVSNSGAGRWARQYGNITVTLLAQASRTTNQTVRQIIDSIPGDIENYNWRGIRLILNVVSGTGGGLVVRLQGRANAATSDTFFNVNDAPTAVTGPGTYVYEFYPGATTTPHGDIVQITSGTVPRNCQVLISVSNSNAYVYSLSYEGIL